MDSSKRSPFSITSTFSRDNASNAKRIQGFNTPSTVEYKAKHRKFCRIAWVLLKVLELAHQSPPSITPNAS